MTTRTSNEHAAAMDQIKITTAEEELRKNPDLKMEDLALLREWLAQNPHLPQVSERQLILFHHSCYYNLEHTKSCIEVYYMLRTNSPEMFKDRDVRRPELQTALSVLDFCDFPVRDPNGYQVMFHRLHEFEPSRYVFQDGVKLLGMTMDACLFMDGTAPGFVMLFDMHGVRLGHLTRLSLRLLSRLFTYVQDGNPVRLKAVHIINVNSLIDKIMFLIKPFMKKELLSILHFHKGNNETLHEFLPKSCLPSDYGGDLESVEVLHARHCKKLENLCPYFQEEEADRIDEKKRLKGKKGKLPADNFTPPQPVSFQSLDID